MSFLIADLQLKSIFIQKEPPVLVLSLQLSEIFNNEVFNFEKKDHYKKRGSDIYRKSNDATTSPKFLYFSLWRQQGI